MSKLTTHKNGQLPKSKNGRKDEFGLNDILSQIGVQGADLGNNLGNELDDDLGNVKEDVEGTTEEPKKPITKPSIAPKTRKAKKSKVEEKDYVTAKVERPILDLIRAFAPGINTQDKLNTILLKWVKENQESILRKTKRDFKKLNNINKLTQANKPNDES